MTGTAGGDGPRPPDGTGPGEGRPATPPLPALDEETATQRLAEASEALVDGVRATLGAWAVRAADDLLDAWGRLDAARRREVVEEVGRAGERAARRVAAELAAVLAVDPAGQRSTPLQIIRSAVVEPTEVLAASGLPDVVRDPFDERSWPGDRFGLVPRTLRDVDPDLAAVHFAWGVAKAAVLRARAGRGQPPR